MPIFIWACFFVLGLNAQAADITANTTWSKEQSPIIISENIWLKAGVVLTIEPGVIIKFEQNIYLIISGVLNAQGNKENPIVFTSIKDDVYGGDTNGDSTATSPQSGDWAYLSINSGGEVNLNYVLVQYGGSANYDGAIKSYKGKLNIINSIITKNNAAINLNQSVVTISYSSINNNVMPFVGGVLVDAAISNNAQADITVDASNNWWGNVDGPCPWRQLLPPGVPIWQVDIQAICGDKPLVDSGVVYEPWLTMAPSDKPTKSNPVIIVPGIMGSDLINAPDPDDKIWLDVNRIIGSPSDDFLNYLDMDNNGNSINAVNVGDAIREIKALGIYNLDVLNGLINYLQTNGYQENKNLFVFSYDWRQNIDLTATQLNQKILDVLSQTGAQKVNVIAHSMGGLVVKDYMKEYLNQNKINKFIDIATPHFGAPAAFKALKYGDNMGFKFILNENEIKSISQNMPSVYELLPSAAYYDPNHIDYNFVYSDQGFKHDYNDLNSYLRIWNNPILVNEAKEFHNNIDDYSSYAGDTETYNIIGCGYATVGKIIKLNQEKDHNEYRIDYISGDGTVPLKSAEGIPVDEKYYYDGAEHMSLLGANGVAPLVDSILDGGESQFNLSSYPMSTHSDICQIRGQLFSFHSPITLNAYDENGNHAGPDANGDIENQIPGAKYDIIEDNKFVFLPAGHIYKVTGQATGLGTFNSRVETINDGTVTQTAYYNQIPLTTLNANVEMTVMDNQTDYTMKIDQDGDQVFETAAQPSSMLNEQESADTIKPETAINILGTQVNDNWYISPVNISLTANDDKNGSGVLKTEYSLDDGQTWQIYTDAINVDKQGANKILFKSTDRAGNIEEEKTMEFKIDSIPPTIEMITPLINDEYNHDENLEILYNSIDNTSGLNDAATKMQIDGQDIGSTTIDLFLYSLGAHQLVIKIFDMAGNQTTAVIPFSVATSLFGAQNDIKRLFLEKQIIKVSTRDELIEDLNSLQQYVERFGKRQNKLLSDYQKRLARCDKLKNGAANCKELVKKLYERQEYVLNKVNEKIVANRLTGLLKDLDKYYTKKWATPKAYEMIKEDLIYLKNNL
ncbi:MAG: alpha/beta hydrolase [Patescibacteria group bacterium]